MESKLVAGHLVLATRLNDKQALERLVASDPTAAARLTDEGVTAVQVRVPREAGGRC